MPAFAAATAFMAQLTPSISPNRTEAGVDEAGRGCLAGPVVAAAVVLPKGFAPAELTDSKQLKRPVRLRLRAEILAHATAWGLGMRSPAAIDRENILQASISAMHEALDQLPPPVEHIAVDGKFFRPYPGIQHTAVIKGDAKYLHIAAASVLAKTFRDEVMQLLAEDYPGYGWHTNVGYPTRAHREAIARLGVTRWHRRSFKLLPTPELFNP